MATVPAGIIFVGWRVECSTTASQGPVDFNFSPSYSLTDIQNDASGRIPKKVVNVNGTPVTTPDVQRVLALYAVPVYEDANIKTDDPFHIT